MLAKIGIVAALGWAQLGGASCCRSNRCLKAILVDNPLIAAKADCSKYISGWTVTVTPSVTVETVTSTLVVSSAHVKPVTQTDETTSDTTTTASTQTLLFTESTTTTTSTTDLTTSTSTTIVSTETLTSTAVISMAPVKRRAPGGAAPGAPFSRTATVPAYAAAACKNAQNYVKGCACAGVAVPTVTLGVDPTTTVTVTRTDVSTVESTEATVTSTETRVVSVTETTSTTTTDVDSATITETTTQVDVEPATTTTTTTVEPVQTACGIPQGAVQIGLPETGRQLYLHPNSLVTWETGPQSPSQQWRYNWHLEEGTGRVYILDNGVMFYILSPVAHMDPSFLQVATAQVGQIWINDRWDWVKGCVETAGGGVRLSAGSRTTVLADSGMPRYAWFASMVPDGWSLVKPTALQSK